MNGTYRIVGGKKLRGVVTPIPNKNSLMGALPLAVVADGGMAYPGLPDTSDVTGFLEIFRSVGAEISKTEDVTTVDSRSLAGHTILTDLGRSFRGAFSLAGPLLARFGKAVLPIPGGCKLGARSISTHVNGFKALGMTIDVAGDVVTITKPKSWSGHGAVWLNEASVTATINIASFAAATECEVEISNAACEPHVVDVLRAMSDMGATIEGIGTNRLLIRGSAALRGKRFTASPDFVDTAGYCVAAGVTGGRIEIKDADDRGFLRGIVQWLGAFGLDVHIRGRDVVADGSAGLEILQDAFPRATRELPKLAAAPWPGFPVDVLPVMVTLGTRAKGRLLYQNWMYESGFDFVRELIYLGADIYMSDPQRIIVMEPRTEYRGGVVGSPGVIQGIKAIFLAALSNDVETVIHGTDLLKRRYPDILNTYRRLGAEITAVPSVGTDVPE